MKFLGTSGGTEMIKLFFIYILKIFVLSLKENKQKTKCPYDSICIFTAEIILDCIFFLSKLHVERSLYIKKNPVQFIKFQHKIQINILPIKMNP